MRIRALGLYALLLASTSFAAETPRYDKPGGWVEAADLDKATRSAAGPFVILDKQVRAEDGSVTTYSDFAVSIDSPQALSQFGTLTAQWLPDKGDLVIHRAALVRDGAEIDLLGRSKFTVLRREQELEQRALTGALTATMPVSGARIGDIVRLTYSVSVRDAAIGGQVQYRSPILVLPSPPGMGRLRLSWLQDEAIGVGAGPRFDLPSVTTKAGYRQIDIALDRKKPDEMPADSPARYLSPPIVQMTSFADWEQVSRTMAPLFATEGAIARNGPIAAEIARIVRDENDPRARAGAALKLVQDRIAYLAQGMDGGNYVPQSPEATWEARYGDCKAKTLLLAAMLREMGIAAEPVLVSATAGDSIEEGLPMPAAFDHVVVRATIDGRDLWLDGTGAGSQAASLEDVPPFGWGLPLTSAGSGLVGLPRRAPALPSVSIVSKIDSSAGIDFPALYDVRVEVTGSGAAMLEQFAKMPSSKQRDQVIDQFVGNFMGQGANYERVVSYDAERSIGTISAKGMANSPFNRAERRAEYAPNLFSREIGFDGNRSRAAWREIPVALAPADRRRSDITVNLPPLEGYTLSGGPLQATVPGVTIDRVAKLEGSTLRIIEEVATTGGELAAADIAAHKPRFAAIAASQLRLRAPADAPRAWDAAKLEPARIRAIEEVYGRLIANDKDNGDLLIGRASLYWGMRDWKRALADYDKLVALDPSADNYSLRASARQGLGDFAGATADSIKASELDPTAARKAQHASALALEGRAAEALPLIDGALEMGGSDERPGLLQMRAEILARQSRAPEGLQSLVELVLGRPGDPSLLNSLCWFGGLWQADLKRLAADCDAAVNASNFAPGVLDSRALANLRLGKLEAALADVNAALMKNPGQEQSLLLRGLIRGRMGDRAGEQDITEALRRRPGLRREYAAYGLIPA